VDHNLPVGEGLNTRELIQKQKTISKMPSVSQASVALTLFEILQMRIVRKTVMGDTTFEDNGTWKSCSSHKCLVRRTLQLVLEWVQLETLRICWIGLQEFTVLYLTKYEDKELGKIFLTRIDRSINKIFVQSGQISHPHVTLTLHKFKNL
jgi:hypothetical protein